jgi:hypothetical protein
VSPYAQDVTKIGGLIGAVLAIALVSHARGVVRGVHVDVVNDDSRPVPFSRIDAVRMPRQAARLSLTGYAGSDRSSHEPSEAVV